MLDDLMRQEAALLQETASTTLSTITCKTIDDLPEVITAITDGVTVMESTDAATPEPLTIANLKRALRPNDANSAVAGTPAIFCGVQRPGPGEEDLALVAECPESAGQ